MTLDEWVDTPALDEDRDSDQRGKHPSFGYPGKLAAAENHAPAEATDDQIRDVAQEASNREVPVEQVWRERVNQRVDRY